MVIEMEQVSEAFCIDFFTQTQARQQNYVEQTVFLHQKSEDLFKQLYPYESIQLVPKQKRKYVRKKDRLTEKNEKNQCKIAEIPTESIVNNNIISQTDFKQVKQVVEVTRKRRMRQPKNSASIKQPQKIKIKAPPSNKSTKKSLLSIQNQRTAESPKKIQIVKQKKHPLKQQRISSAIQKSEEINQANEVNQQNEITNDQTANRQACDQQGYKKSQNKLSQNSQTSLIPIISTQAKTRKRRSKKQIITDQKQEHSKREYSPKNNPAPTKKLKFSTSTVSYDLYNYLEQRLDSYISDCRIPLDKRVPTEIFDIYIEKQEQKNLLEEQEIDHQNFNDELTIQTGRDVWIDDLRMFGVNLEENNTWFGFEESDFIFFDIIKQPKVVKRSPKPIQKTIEKQKQESRPSIQKTS